MSVNQRQMIIVGGGAVAAWLILRHKPRATLAPRKVTTAGAKIGTPTAGGTGILSSNQRPSANLATRGGTASNPQVPSLQGYGAFATAIAASVKTIGDLFKRPATTGTVPQSQNKSGQASGGPSGGASSGSRVSSPARPGASPTAYDPWSDVNNYNENGQYIGPGAWDDNGDYVGGGLDPYALPILPDVPTRPVDPADIGGYQPIDVLGQPDHGDEYAMQFESPEPAVVALDPSLLPGSTDVAPPDVSLDPESTNAVDQNMLPGFESVDSGAGNGEDAWTEYSDGYGE